MKAPLVVVVGGCVSSVARQSICTSLFHTLERTSGDDEERRRRTTTIKFSSTCKTLELGASRHRWLVMQLRNTQPGAMLSSPTHPGVFCRRPALQTSPRRSRQSEIAKRRRRQDFVLSSRN
uniref:Putative secreted protein n=1 Tax=Anopheles darlingi TaxID=43151 RepID=A0A2M4D2E1_ANODA